MTVTKLQRLFAVAILAFCFAATVLAQTSADALKKGFENPPPAARPRVWWHWMNGNITREGIKLDLEWMHRVGIAGFQNFDAALATPQVVDKRLVYMTPEWKDAFKYAITLGDQLGMEMAIAGSPGWSESGGPWVPPSHGMKKYVWSEIVVEGGKPVTQTLPQPPATVGPFQNISRTTKVPSFYADAAVVAFRQPEAEAQDLTPAKITASGGGLDASKLSDGDLVTTTGLPIPDAEGGESWILFEYPAPHTVCSLTYVTKDPNTGKRL